MTDNKHDALKPCPCGQTPTELRILSHDGNTPKWAMAVGACCDEWHIEFRCQYAHIGSEKAKRIAIEAWNTASRPKA